VAQWRRATLAAAITAIAIGGSGCGDAGSASGHAGTVRAGGPHASATRASGTPASGTPATGTPASGAPATGTPAAGAPATGTRTGARASETHIGYVRPTTKTGSLKPGYVVAERLAAGLCDEDSVFASGVAYSCTVGEEGIGPCWPIGEAAKTKEVFCLNKPWEHSGTEISLRRSPRYVLPVKPSERAIWGVELTTGQRCDALRGAVGMFDRVPIDFACGRSGVELLGQPDMSQAVWTIREVLAHREKNGFLSHMPGPTGHVAVTWYGVGARTQGSAAAP